MVWRIYTGTYGFCVQSQFRHEGYPKQEIQFLLDRNLCRKKPDGIYQPELWRSVSHSCQTAREIRLEFNKAIREVKRDDTLRRIRESEQLIYDTVHKNSSAVAAQIEKIHAEETAILYYNNEQALRSVIKLAYFSYKDHYLKFEELPSGQGYADIVYFPKKTSPLPALVIELKWNQSAKGAIQQIKEKAYPSILSDYGGDILLVGISYEKDNTKTFFQLLYKPKQMR